jgi:hypothetical protein
VASAAAVAFLAYLLVLVGEFLQLVIREMFDIDHLILCLIDGLDDLIELQVNGAGVTVLRVLDQKHHEESDDGSASIDDELPGIGIMEVRPGDQPQRDDEQSREERPFRTDQIGGFRSKDVKAFLRLAPIFSHCPTIGKPALRHQPGTSPGINRRRTGGLLFSPHFQ